MSINGKSLIATILPTLNDIGKTCFGRFQSPTDFTPKYPGYSYGFTAQRIHSDVISLQCHPAYTDDTEFYEYEISKSQWSYKGNLITNTDFAIKTLDIDCQAGKTISYALNAYNHIITGVASISNNDYITKYDLVGNGLIITSTTAHAVKVYYFNRPK